MVRCSFCREHIEPGTGKIFVKNDGRIFAFCSKTCQKHIFKLEHKARDIRWTKVFAQEKKTKEKSAE